MYWPYLYPETLAARVDLDLVRVAVGLGFLVVAGAMDWRKRVVRDPVWVAMGGVALALVEVDLLAANAAPFLHLMTAATAILYFGVFFGEPSWGEKGFTLRPSRLALYLLPPIFVLLVWRWAVDAESLGWFYRLLTMPGMIVVAHGMYEFSLLRGGADAKAVMALALLFPGVYPHLGSFPLLRPMPAAEPILAVLFPFAFVVLVDAALLFVFVPLLLLARNAAAGHMKLPRALFGYRVPIGALPRYAWLMDRIEDGKPVHVHFPRHREDRDEQVRLLREHGFEHAWVTPQLPFVTAMLIGFVLAAVAGNLLLGLLRVGG